MHSTSNCLERCIDDDSETDPNTEPAPLGSKLVRQYRSSRTHSARHLHPWNDNIWFVGYRPLLLQVPVVKGIRAGV